MFYFFCDRLDSDLEFDFLRGKLLRRYRFYFRFLIRRRRLRFRLLVIRERLRFRLDLRKKDKYKGLFKSLYKSKRRRLFSSFLFELDYDGGLFRIKNIEKEKIEKIIKSKEERK